MYVANNLCRYGYCSRSSVLTLNPIDDTCNTKTAYATSVIDTCFGNMNLYSWTFPGGDISSSNLETPPAVNYNAVGTYWIYDSVANQCGSDYDSVSFTIHENPSISLLLTDSTCILIVYKFHLL